VVTFRGSIPNFAPFHTQIHIHFKASTGNATHYTIQRFPQRTRMPSRRTQKANQAFEIYEDLKAYLKRLFTTNPQPQEASSTPHSISKQALSTPAQPISTNNSGETTISQPTISRRSSRRIVPTSIAKVSVILIITQIPPRGVVPAFTAEVSVTSTITQMPPRRKVLPKLLSVLNQSKSARQLRQNFITALFPMLAKPIVS
jgi:hypothetical protein